MHKGFSDFFFFTVVTLFHSGKECFCLGRIRILQINLREQFFLSKLVLCFSDFCNPSQDQVMLAFLHVFKLNRLSSALNRRWSVEFAVVPGTAPVGNFFCLILAYRGTRCDK